MYGGFSKQKVRSKIEKGSPPLCEKLNVRGDRLAEPFLYKKEKDRIAQADQLKIFPECALTYRLLNLVEQKIAVFDRQVGT